MDAQNSCLCSSSDLSAALCSSLQQVAGFVNPAPIIPVVIFILVNFICSKKCLIEPRFLTATRSSSRKTCRRLGCLTLCLLWFAVGQLPFHRGVRLPLLTSPAGEESSAAAMRLVNHQSDEHNHLVLGLYFQAILRKRRETGFQRTAWTHFRDQDWRGAPDCNPMPSTSTPRGGRTCLRLPSAPV